MTFRFLTIYPLLCLSDTASSLGSSLHSVGNAQGSDGSQLFLNLKFTSLLPLLALTSHTVSELQPGSQMVVIASLLSHSQEKRSWKSHIRIRKIYLSCFQIIIIIIIIIIFINCNWVVTRWQWLFYMYTKYEIGYY